jgi:IS30 family transposase
LDISSKQLRHKGKRRNPKETRGKFLIGKSISNRSKGVKKRTEFSHYEIDTMVSSRGKSKGCFATFCEMKSRFYIAFKIPDRSGEPYKTAVDRLFGLFPKNAFLSFTSDRGKEFSCYKYIEDTYKIDFYFADPYSAWQRGSNKNSNGLLREFYPKKTDLATVNNEELRRNLFLINNRPRKCLGRKSAYEVFFNEVVHLI